MSAASPNLLIGMSHTRVIRRAIEELPELSIRVIDLNASPEVYQREGRTFDLKKIDAPDPEHVFLSIEGNAHAIVGLIESPEPFAVVDSDGNLPADMVDRTLIVRSMMKDLLTGMLEAFLPQLAAFQDRFRNAQVHFLCSPPPVYSNDHLLEFPSVFADRIHQGISPPSLRRSIYDLSLIHI